MSKTMSPEEEVERLKALCKQVVNEKDPRRFSDLLEELDQVLKTAGKSPEESATSLPKTA